MYRTSKSGSKMSYVYKEAHFVSRLIFISNKAFAGSLLLLGTKVDTTMFAHFKTNSTGKRDPCPHSSLGPRMVQHKHNGDSEAYLRLSFGNAKYMYGS